MTPNGYTHKRIMRVIETRQDKPEPEASDLLYQPRSMLQTQFPKRKPDGLVWRHQAGNHAIVMVSGHDSHGNPLGIPYGSRARLIMMWLAKLVKEQTKPSDRAPKIMLEGSYNDFLRILGYARDSRARNDLKKHLEMFLNCQISIFELHPDVKDGHTRQNKLVSQESRLWFANKKTDQISLFPNYIQLTAEFTEILRNSPIPVDVEVVRALKDNALALDMYTMLSHATYVAYTKNRPSPVIQWSRMHERFGSEYRELRDFKKEAIKIIHRLEAIIGHSNVTLITGDSRRGAKVSRYGGFIVNPSMPQVVPYAPTAY